MGSSVMYGINIGSFFLLPQLVAFYLKKKSAKKLKGIENTWQNMIILYTFWYAPFEINISAFSVFPPCIGNQHWSQFREKQKVQNQFKKFNVIYRKVY